MISLLNGEATELPEMLVKNEAIFKSVLNMDAWETLAKEEKKHLMKFLPSLNGFENDNFKEDTVRSILSDDQGFKYGNPVQILFDKLKAGLLAPSVVELKDRCRKLKIKNYKLKQKEYYKNLLQEIIVTRQMVLDKAYRYGPGCKFPKRLPPLAKPLSDNGDKVKRKYEKIIKDVRSECGDDIISSDEEYGISSTTNSNSQVGRSTANLKVYTNDVISPPDFKLMLDCHRRKRLLSDNHAELDTTNISLADVIMRCNSIKKSGKGKNKKLKNKKGKGKKKHFIKNAVLKGCPNISTLKEPDRLSDKKKESIKAHSLAGYPHFESFFSLLGYFFEQQQDKMCTQAVLEEKLIAWQSHRSSNLCGWKALYADWVPLLKYVIDYMAGEGTASLLHDFSPLLVSGNDEEWTWAGPDHTNDEVILPLCNHFLETLSQAMNAESCTDEKDRKTIDTTRTSYVVSSSTPEEKELFRKQEKERFMNPHRPNIYTTHGYQSIVGPVKGVFSSKYLSGSKAREHAMLASERPAYVTILCLVRDAVARLPNGKGTRTDVCTLLKDSQYLNPDSSDSQVHGVVSGALDRLHAEKDPCVKFDPVRKLWIYLHRTRSMEEFQRLHDASAAAALAKKQLSQSKQKSTKKKPTTEVPESTPEKSGKSKKEVTPKIRKSSNKPSDQVVTKDIKEEEPSSLSVGSEIAKHVVNEEPKKKSRKRKKSVNGTSGNKCSKTHELEVPKNEIVDELELSLENEALMATQSILSDEEASDIFCDKRDNSDFLGIDSFATPSDDLPSPDPLTTPFELASDLGNVNDAAFDMNILQNRNLHESTSEPHNSNLDSFITNFEPVDIIKPTAGVGKDSAGQSESLDSKSFEDSKGIDFSLSRIPMQKEMTLSQLSNVLGDKSLLDYDSGKSIVLSSLNTSSSGTTKTQKIFLNPPASFESTNTKISLHPPQHHMMPPGNIQLQKLASAVHQLHATVPASQSESAHQKLLPLPQQHQQQQQQHQSDHENTPEIADCGRKTYLKHQSQLQQLLQRNQQQPPQPQTNQASQIAKSRKDNKEALNRTKITQGNTKPFYQQGLKHDVPLSSGIRQQLQQTGGKVKYAQPQVGLNISNMLGSSVQTLSQFISSKSLQFSKANVAVSLSLTTPITTVAFNSSGSTTSTLPSHSLKLSTSAAATYQYQLKQQMPKSTPVTGIKVSDTTSTAIDFQTFAPNQGCVSHFRIQGSPASNLPPPQLADVKGCRGNQIITGQPPSSLVKQKINLVQKASTGGAGSPLQTFSLNQLMAAARANETDSSSTVVPKVQAVPVPASQVMYSSNSSSPATSIQALLQVVPKLGNNTHVLIQRQLPGNADSNMSKVVRLPKTFRPPNHVSGPRHPQHPTLTFQKIDNAGGQILNQQALSGSQKGFQRLNPPSVAPLKISLPRANFSGMQPTVSLTTPGQTVRLSSSDMRMPSPVVKTSSTPVPGTYSNPDVLPKLQGSNLDKDSC